MEKILVKKFAENLKKINFKIKKNDKKIFKKLILKKGKKMQRKKIVNFKIIF